ncbi:MAG: amtA [Candidatus Nitrosotenuis sp.]|nr:amtA [Candidatus Nitrosotenuis sp.]
MPLDASDTTWIIVATGLVMMMTPALGFFEAGLLRSKNSLSVIMQTFSGLAILSALWFILGFTMVYGQTLSGIIGGSDWLFFNGVPHEEALSYAPTIPGITFASYMMMLAVITPLLMTGAIAERTKWSAFLVLMIAWSIFIYYPLAHWVWGKGGWLAQIGVFDFAGGIVIHTSAGMSSLAAAIVLKRRKNFGTALLLPHNIPLAVIGASLLWLGWFGFNAGSGFITGALASNVLLVTHIGSAMGAIVWMLLSWKRSGRASLTAVINGALVGLVAVTPSAAYITAQNAFFLAIIAGLISYFAMILFKEKLKIDDALDVGAVHGVTGITGSLAVGFIASNAINHSVPNGLLMGGGPALLQAQAIGVGVAIILGFGGTLIISKIINKIMGLRVKEAEEDICLDITQHAEKAYLE